MARREIAKVLAATMLGTLDTTALLPVIALYAQFRGADTLTTGVIVGLYSAVHAPANLVFGRLVDRWGRKVPMGLGLLWDAVSVFLYSLATTPLLLAFVRVSHGIGGGLVGPSTMSLAADTATEERKGRAMAVYGMSIALAVVVGTGMATPVTTRLGYAALFYILSTGLVAGFLISRTIREPRISRQLRPIDRPRLLRYLRRPEPLAGYAGIFSLHFVLGTFVTLAPLYLVGERGFGVTVVGLSFFTFAVASFLFHYLGGVLADRHGSALPTLVGLAVVAASMAAIPVARELPVLLALMAFFGLGHGFVFPGSSALVSRRADPDQLGIVTGLFYAILVIGVALGAPVMAAVASVSSIGIGIAGSSAIGIVGIAFAARAWLHPAERPAASVVNSAATEPDLRKS